MDDRLIDWLCPDIAPRYGGHSEIIMIMLSNDERMKKARQELRQISWRPRSRRGSIHRSRDYYRIVELGSELRLWHIFRKIRTHHQIYECNVVAWPPRVGTTATFPWCFCSLWYAVKRGIIMVKRVRYYGRQN